MREGPTKGPRGVHKEARETINTPRRPELQADLPADFDPDLSPILARHWFGVHPHGVSALWWRFAGLGHRLPAEPGIILIDGGRDGL